MRKWRVQPLVVCVLLLSFVLPICSVAAESVGKNCSKAGVIAGTKKNPLVCKKVGKKLLWRPLNLSVEGTNGTAGIKSVKILWNQPPKFGGQQFSFDFELACGKVMSITGPQRYPEVRFTYLVGKLSHENWGIYSPISMVGLPTLSNGGNKASYQFVGMAPLVNDAHIQVRVLVKDVDAPTCTASGGEVQAATSERFIVQLTADTATTVVNTSKPICPTGGFSYSVGPVEKGLYSPSSSGKFPGYTWYRDMYVKGSFTNNSTADMKVWGEAVIGNTPPPNDPMYPVSSGWDFYWGGTQQGSGILVSKGATVTLKSFGASFVSSTFPVFLNANFKVQWNDTNLNSSCPVPIGP